MKDELKTKAVDAILNCKKAGVNIKLFTDENRTYA
jgi:hypothetical protein